MTARDVISQALALSEAATDGPWRTWVSASDSARDSAVETAWTYDSDGDTNLITDYMTAPDAAFTAAARTLLPALAKALGDVLKPEMVQGPDWLGDKRTYDSADAEEPGSDEYMEYIERVLTAAGYEDIPWGPVTLAIALDRLIRANEDHTAITAALSEVTP